MQRWNGARLRAGGCGLARPLLHYTIRTLAEHYAKQEAFTTRAAEELYARGRRQLARSMWVAAPWTLLQKFVLQLGFLDGYRGALIAWTSARYVWMKYRKLGVLARGGKLPDRAWPQAGTPDRARTAGRTWTREWRGGQSQALLLLQGLRARRPRRWNCVSPAIARSQRAPRRREFPCTPRRAARGGWARRG